MNRLSKAWKALTEKTPVVYAYDSTPRLVQLQYYEGMILGLSNQGDLYEIKFDYPQMLPTITKLMRNPLRRDDY